MQIQYVTIGTGLDSNWNRLHSVVRIPVFILLIVVLYIYRMLLVFPYGVRFMPVCLDVYTGLFICLRTV